MANYYIDRYNEFLENANGIYEYLSGNYMDIYEGKMLDCGPLEDSIEGVKITEIAQYRKMENDQVMFETIKNAVFDSLSSLHRLHCAAGYFLVSNRKEVKLYFASEVATNTSFEVMLKSVLPDVELRNGSFVSKTDLSRMAQYGGVVTGTFSITRSIVDEIFDSIMGKESIVGIIARPIDRIIANRYCKGLSEIAKLVSSFESVNDSFGNGSRVTVSRQFPGVSILKEFLEKQNKRMIQNQNDLWNMCIWFGSFDECEARELGGTLAGILTAADDAKVEKGRYYLTTPNPLKNAILAFSSAHYDNLTYHLDPALRKSGLVSWVTTEELSSMFQLPMRSHIGIHVMDTNKGANNISVFDTHVPLVGEDSFVFGNEVDTNQEYRLSLSDFTEHVLVTGGSGGGKTNTVLTLLENLYHQKIPFCVIEPSKKEYWHMIGAVSNLKVFSSGYDAMPLGLNPLEPEDGVRIGNHIDDLMYAFSGAFEMEVATRLSLEGLIQYTYQKLGWKLDTLAYKQSKRYPTLRDVRDNLDEYSKTEIHSGEEVKSNIKGSIARRLDFLISGPVGNITNSNTSITGQDLCSGSVLIELDDLSIESKPFITSLLLIKMNQYLRQRDTTNSLKNVVVLEEAHNVFAEISKNGVETSKDIASKYFSNMLSEIRAFGTGMIIADQGASQINSNAVANTKIKIVHALSREDDADSESFAFRLNRFQKERLPELKRGEAIVAVRGQTSVCKVNVKKSNISRVDNYACIFCKNRAFCEINEVKAKINVANRSELLLARVYNDRYNAFAIRNEVDTYLNSLRLSDNLNSCAFGYLLAHMDMPCGEREKRRILYRYLEQ